MTEAAVENVDILIIGAGPVGLTLHLALAAGGQQSLLLDRRPLASQQGDPRALALSHGARQLLEQINSWPNRAATPIETIHISQKDGFGRTLIDHADYALPALGYVVRYRDLAGALAANLAPEAVRTEAEILDIAPGEEHVTVSLRHAGQVQTIRTKLLVHAEGTPGDDPAVSVSDYAQHAVICEVMPTPGHGNRAWERFTPDGPLALLPLGDEYSIVFTLPPAKADAVMALDDAAFIAALQQQFGQRAAEPLCRQPSPRPPRQRLVHRPDRPHLLQRLRPGEAGPRPRPARPRRLPAGPPLRRQAHDLGRPRLALICTKGEAATPALKLQHSPLAMPA